jgi:D-aminoacyl-tRNA deacylase
MRLLLQRVEKAEVVVKGKIIASISHGILAFLGIHKEDTRESIEPLVLKLSNLRLFSDADGKNNLSVLEMKGSILLVSQFTLYADCSKGRRPDYFASAGAAQAEPLYLEFLSQLKALPVQVEAGQFGAHMKVSLINDGPITLLLEK